MSYIIALTALALLAIGILAGMVWALGWRFGIALIVLSIATSLLCTWAINVVVAHQ